MRNDDRQARNPSSEENYRLQAGNDCSSRGVARQAEARANLSEAIRRLVELGLTVKRPVRAKSHKTAKRAAELAANEIDKQIDPAAPLEERAVRKQRTPQRTE
jgi:hypothetical protein